MNILERLRTKRKTRRTARTVPPVALDVLEPRQLLTAADLVVSNALFLTPTVARDIYAQPGEVVEMSATVVNQGNDRARDAFSVGLYESVDGQYDSFDQRVDAFTIPTLAVGADASDTFAFYAPSAPGTYYYSVAADDLSSVTELNEYNNWSYDLTITVRGVAAQPVTLTTPATAETVYKGQPYTIRWTGGDPYTTLQIWAYGPDGWEVIADNVSAAARQFTWNTAGATQGWHCFAAWAYDGAQWYSTSSPNWVNVLNANNRAPSMQFTNPVVAQEIERGDVFRLKWNAFDADGDPLYVSLWAYSESTGWFQLPGAEWISAGTGRFDWNTAGYQTGWYAFSAWVWDGQDAVAVNAPDWVHVVLPPHLMPTARFLTPTSTSTVYRGDYFNLIWDLDAPLGGEVYLNLWGYSASRGWFEIGTFDAYAQQIYVDTSGMSSGWYAFTAWVGDGDSWVNVAANDWLLVL